jgi:F0F1-type ATP synthase assembly protein I
VRSMIVGGAAICLGLWGLGAYWRYIVDILMGMFPLALLVFGIVALLAGAKNTGLSARMVKITDIPGMSCPASKIKDEQER